MSKPNDFDEFEKEEAARRAASFDKSAIARKSAVEQAKHDAGVGVETEPTDDGDDDEEEET